MTTDTKDDGGSAFDVGVTRGGLIRQMWRAIKTVWLTWRFTKVNGVPFDKWYGVYEAGTENIVAMCGPLPGAQKRAWKIAAALRQERNKP